MNRQIEQIETMEKQLLAFYQAYGHCYVSPKNDIILFRWLQKIRALKNKLDPSLKYFLETLGFDWNVLNAFDQHWMFMYYELIEYMSKHNTVRVPIRCRENQRLGVWVSEQRKRKHLLAGWKIQLLDKLGFLWKENIASEVERHWLTMYKNLILFKEEHGHTRVPSKWSDQHLSKWVQHQRENEKTMPPYRKENLDAIDFSWYDDIQKEEEQRWEENYQKLLQFKKTYGHLIVPNNDFYHKLHTWVSRQRKDEKIISVIHKKKLNAIEFRWKRNIKIEQAIAWDNKFEELKAFYENHGHCQVPNHSKEFPQLGVWVQRHRRLWDKLDKKKRNKLEELNFVTSSAIEKKRRQHWINMLAKLKKFKNEFGHCRVPSYYKPNLTLGSWVEFQRLLENKLEGWKKRQLIALGFEWSSDIQGEKIKRWDEMFKKLVKFYERFGHSSVPEGWNDDPKLATWVSYQRHPKKPHSRERKDLLKQVKFEFKPKPHHRKRDEKGHFITSTKSL